MNYFILSIPRSGSSYLADNLIKSGKKNFNFFSKINMNSYELNPKGYNENTFVTLLNDQMIKLYYGSRYSFLYPPFKNTSHKNINFNVNFSYDLDKKNIYIPKNYKKNLYSFTGFNWDVWGLSRMSSKKKWYQAYQKHNLKNYNDILIAKKKFENKLNSINNYIIKDPRFMFTFKHYNIKNFKILLLMRNKKDLLNSLRRHYGSRLFTKKYLPNSNIVSNHFNLKVGYLSYSKFYDRYIYFMKIIKKEFRSKTLVIDSKKLFNQEKKTIRQIHSFIK
tara:strand:+ start:422 stop:1252 length:831 start_codon:yes stop_codon:yes gene_type:complete